MTHLLSRTGIICRLVPCRISRSSLDTIRMTRRLNRSIRYIFGAVILRNSGDNFFIYIIPNSGRVSLGGTTGIDNGGGYRLLPVGRLLSAANCVHNNYSPVNVGGQFPACLRRATVLCSFVCVDTNRHNLRIGLSPSSLLHRSNTICTSLIWKVRVRYILIPWPRRCPLPPYVFSFEF